ncbi:TPA: DNA circularization protein [Yersinia enterocolitica]|nr:DNA circularization protein [Yersinia enterocolitica]
MSLISNALSDLLGTGGDSWQWSEHLHPASFRGVPFAVLTAEGVFGRRQAIHEYPYRDTAWIEDLGRATRRLTIRGFLIQSSGLYTAPDVMTQRDSLIAACEMPDAGTLVHPTLGEMTVSIPESGLRLNEGAESGRVFEFTLTIIESGLRVFSVTSSADAVSSIQSSWFGLASKSVATFIATVKGEIRSVTQTIRTLKSTAAFWVNMVNSTTNEATNLGNVLRSTLGRDRYGRYNHGTVGGSVSGATASVSTQSDTTNLSALVAKKMAVSVEGRASLAAATYALKEVATVARSRDPEATQMRYRNRIIIVESTMKALKLAQQCIDWEMNRRYGRSKELLVTVDSWRDKNGKLWEPNTLIPIDLPVFGLKDELWLLSEVTYLKDDHGTAAQMVLMPPEAFTVQPYQFYSNLMELNPR